MLLIDLGNRALKAQSWGATDLQSSFLLQLQSGWQRTLEDYLARIDAQHCYYASVANCFHQQTLLASLEQRLESSRIHPLESAQQCAGVSNAYRVPQTLGVDRWLALLGAASISQTDAMIVDAGSAITVDLLKKNGQHLGGAILPGFNTSGDQLQAILRSANFNAAEIDAVEHPGRSTEGCIHLCNGNQLGPYLDQLIDRWFNLLDQDAVLILSGGDADRIGKHPQHSCLRVPDLVFIGMRQQLQQHQ